MKKIKILISIILVAVLTLSNCSFFASADVLSEGKCGDNLTYTLSDDGILTISGTGDMYDYTTDSPFYKNSKIKEVIIENGVTSVGVWAFSECTALKSVVMADSVKRLDECAFYKCIALASIDFSDNLEGIYSHAFYGCNKLTDITIPDSVKIIDDSAFYMCNSLARVATGNGVESIERYAFYYCPALTDVSIGDSVKRIGDQAFSNCSRLKNITFGKGLKEIAYGAFWGCSQLTTVVLPDSIEILDDNAFYQCSAISTLTTGNNLKHIGQNAISSTKWSSSQQNGLLVLGGVIVGYKGTAPSHLDLSDVDAVSIAEYAFTGNTSITEITLSDKIKNIGDYAFRSCNRVTAVHFAEGLETLGTGAFATCISLTEANLPDSLITMGDEVFYSCNAMVTATIGKNTSDIGTSPFSSCSALKTVTVDPENQYYCDVDGVVYNKDITTLVQCPLGVEDLKCTIPYNVTSIDDVELGRKSRVTKVNNFTVRCYRYTAAEAFAKKRGLAIEYLDDVTISIKGDVNNDGEVSIADAVISARYSADLTQLTASEFLAGDLDGNQVLDVSDAVLIARSEVGLTNIEDYSWLLMDGNKEYSAATSAKPNESYVYKTVGNKNLIINVYYPAGGLKDNNAAVICYEGSAWNPRNSTTNSWDGSYLKYTAQYFAKQGFVGIEVNYRSLYTDVDTSVWDCIEDCADGYKYVTENLSYINPDMTALVGESAGGHIALMMELCDLYTGTHRPQAIVAMNPTIYLNEGYCLRTSLSQLAPSIDGLKEASPIYNLQKADTKIIITQGESDTVTPLKYSQEFYDEMKAIGNDIHLLTLEGQEHSCLLYNYLNTDTYINTQMDKVYSLVKNAMLF